MSDNKTLDFLAALDSELAEAKAREEKRGEGGEGNHYLLWLKRDVVAIVAFLNPAKYPAIKATKLNTYRNENKLQDQVLVPVVVLKMLANGAPQDMAPYEGKMVFFEFTHNRYGTLIRELRANAVPNEDVETHNMIFADGLDEIYGCAVKKVGEGAQTVFTFTPTKWALQDKPEHMEAVRKVVDNIEYKPKEIWEFLSWFDYYPEDSGISLAEALHNKAERQAEREAQNAENGADKGKQEPENAGDDEDGEDY